MPGRTKQGNGRWRPSLLGILIAVAAAAPATAKGQDPVVALSRALDDAGDALVHVEDDSALELLGRVRQFLLRNPGLDLGAGYYDEVGGEAPQLPPLELVLAADLDLRDGAPQAARAKIRAVRLQLSQALVVALSRAEGAGALGDALSFDASAATSFTLRWLQRAKILDRDFRGENAALRRRYPHLGKEELADVLIREAALKTGLVGAVAAIPGILPFAGTALRIGALVPEFYYVFREQARLAFRIADLYGFELDSEEKATELLLMLGTSGGVANSASAVESYLEMRLAKGIASPATTRLLQRVLAKTMLRYVLSPKALTALGSKLVPGIGIVTSFGIDYAATALLGGAAKSFYGRRRQLEDRDLHEALTLPAVRAAALRAVVKTVVPAGFSEEEKAALRAAAAGMVVRPEPALVEEALLAAKRAPDAWLDALARRPRHVREHIIRLALRAQYADLDRSYEEIEALEKLTARLGFDLTHQETARRIERVELSELARLRVDSERVESLFESIKRGLVDGVQGLFGGRS